MNRKFKSLLCALVSSAIMLSSISVYAADSYKWYYGSGYKIKIPTYLSNTKNIGNAIVISNTTGTRSITLEACGDSATWNRSGYYGYVENLINFVEKNNGKITGVSPTNYGSYNVSWCLWGQDHAGAWRGANGGCIYFDFAYPPTENLGNDIKAMFDSFQWDLP